MNPIMEELEAQLEDHGVDALQFFLESNETLPDKDIELVVNDVMFEDNKIKVQLTPNLY